MVHMALQAPQTKIHRDEAARARLAELGLSVELLHEVIEKGEAGRASATGLDPLNAPGQLAYIRRIRAIRERLLPQQWTKEDPEGCAMTVAPDGKRQIMVATGDDATGSASDPSTRYPKGTAMKRAVIQNQQLPLPFPTEIARQLPSAERCIRETWVFLVSREEVGKDDDKLTVVHAELSLPDEMQGDFPKGWAERIILPDFEVPSDQLILGVPKFSDGDDIDVAVVRK
jgi:hypothetical protein